MWNFEQCGWNLYNRRLLREREASWGRNIISANLHSLLENNHLDCPIWKPNKNGYYTVQYAQSVFFASTSLFSSIRWDISIHEQMEIKNTQKNANSSCGLLCTEKSLQMSPFSTDSKIFVSTQIGASYAKIAVRP